MREIEAVEAAGCKGANCGTTTGDHSPECVLEAYITFGCEQSDLHEAAKAVLDQHSRIVAAKDAEIARFINEGIKLADERDELRAQLAAQQAAVPDIEGDEEWAWQGPEQKRVVRYRSKRNAQHFVLTNFYSSKIAAAAAFESRVREQLAAISEGRNPPPNNGGTSILNWDLPASAAAPLQVSAPESIRELIAKARRDGTDRSYMLYVLDRIEDALDSPAAPPQGDSVAIKLLRDLDDAWNSHDGRERFGKLMNKVEALLARLNADRSAQGDESNCSAIARRLDKEINFQY